MAAQNDIMLNSCKVIAVNRLLVVEEVLKTANSSVQSSHLPLNNKSTTE